MRGRRRRAVRGGGGDDCQMGDGSELEMLERRQMADGNRVHALREHTTGHDVGRPLQFIDVWFGSIME
jgi:hypothetical protein